MRGGVIDSAIENFYETLHSDEDEPQRLHRDRFMEELVRGTVGKAAEINAEIEKRAKNWRLERMPGVDRNLLRLGIFELKYLGTDPPVVIDETIELARQFSADEAIPFINAVLDAVRRETGP